MMQRIQLFEEALRECNNLMEKYSTLRSLESIRQQLEYLLALEKGDREDRSRLKDIVIGPLTAREIEPLSQKAADLFYRVAAEARSM